MPLPEKLVAIKLDCVYASPRGTHQPGHVIQVPEAEAKQLVEGGHATRMNQEPTPAPTEIRGGSKADAEGDGSDDTTGEIETADADRQRGKGRARGNR